MKAIKSLSLALLMIFFCCGLTSCAGFSDKDGQKIMDKFDEGDMTKEDYTKCMDKVEEYCVYLEEELNQIIADNKNKKKFKKALDDLEEEIDEKWGGIEDVVEVMNKAEEKEMGSSNSKKWEKFSEKWSKKFGETIYKKVDKKFEDCGSEYLEFLEEAHISVGSVYDMDDYDF
ncbi:MAG: hypothetical protein NC402_07190 [Prevotella sp.]|nr:hypothetical protein [Prevotella sp.]MCM1074339.1 hypothetical protein [Ruminococcus sp.]